VEKVSIFCSGCLSFGNPHISVICGPILLILWSFYSPVRPLHVGYVWSYDKMHENRHFFSPFFSALSDMKFGLLKRLASAIEGANQNRFSWSATKMKCCSRWWLNFVADHMNSGKQSATRLLIGRKTVKQKVLFSLFFQMDKISTFFHFFSTFYNLFCLRLTTK
jgi:hypothetical protein